MNRLLLLLSLLCSVANGQTKLPASVYEQLADTSRPYVKLPKGRWAIPVNGEIQVRRSNVVIDGRETVLVPRFGITLPVGVASDAKTRLGTAEVTEQTDTLETATEGIEVGHVHLIRLGVNYSDPQEPEICCWREVIEVSENRIRYNRPFGSACRIFPSYEELGRISGQPYKTGPWGRLPNGYYARGAGHFARRNYLRRWQAD